MRLKKLEEREKGLDLDIGNVDDDIMVQQTRMNERMEQAVMGIDLDITDVDDDARVKRTRKKLDRLKRRV